MDLILKRVDLLGVRGACVNLIWRGVELCGPHFEVCEGACCMDFILSVWSSVDLILKCVDGPTQEVREALWTSF